MNSTDTRKTVDADRNKRKNAQSPRSKTPEIKVDASTLMLIAVVTLLLPLLLAGFFR